MSFSKRLDSDAVCYTKPIDSLKHWNDHFFWVDSFACSASFSWHTGKNVFRYPFLKSTKFNTDHYAILVEHPAPFWKFLEPFLCLVGMSRYYTLDEDTYPSFLHDDGMGGFADHTKVKVGERERLEREVKLLDSTVRRVVLLLSITPARVDSELEASVDRLFDEGGSADEEDFATGGDQEIETELVMGVRIVADENVVAEKPKRPRKKRQAVTDASALLASSMLNVEADVQAVATLPLVTSSVFVTLEHESGVPTDSIAGLNLRTIGASQRSAGVLPVMTEAVITSHVVNAPSVPVSKSDDYDVSREFVDHLAPPALFSQIREMDYHNLFTEFNVRTARQACLNAEVRMQTEYCLSERKRLESECEKQADLLKVRVEEVKNLKVQLLLKETEAAEAARLCVHVAAKATKKMHVDEIDALKQRNVILENEKESLNGKVVELQSSVSTKDLKLKDLNVDVSSLRSQKDSLVDQVHMLETTCFGLCDQVAKLDVDVLEMALHLEEKFYPHLLTTISGWRGCKMYCRPVLTTKRQRLCEVEFPLLGKLKSHKDASPVDVMNTLRLEGSLADALGMSGLQPDVEQLTLPIHCPEDQVVLGETSLSFALSVTHSRVERIRENVTAQRLALIGIWVPLVDPLSAKSLIGEASTSGSMSAAVVTTTTRSTTFAAVSSVPPITIEDYEIVGTDGPEDDQGNGQGNVASFPTLEFEKEELDTTPKRDPPS
nr:hypothetical protein [Tanacetum cinerariifolium]